MEAGTVFAAALVALVAFYALRLAFGCVGREGFSVEAARPLGSRDGGGVPIHSRYPATHARYARPQGSFYGVPLGLSGGGASRECVANLDGGTTCTFRGDDGEVLGTVTLNPGEPLPTCVPPQFCEDIAPGAWPPELGTGGGTDNDQPNAPPGDNPPNEPTGTTTGTGDGDFDSPVPADCADWTQPVLDMLESGGWTFEQHEDARPCDFTKLGSVYAASGTGACLEACAERHDCDGVFIDGDCHLYSLSTGNDQMMGKKDVVTMRKTTGPGPQGDGPQGDGPPGGGPQGDGQPGDGPQGDGPPGGGPQGDGQPGNGPQGDGQPSDGPPGEDGCGSCVGGAFLNSDPSACTRFEFVPARPATLGQGRAVFYDHEPCHYAHLSFEGSGLIDDNYVGDVAGKSTLHVNSPDNLMACVAMCEAKAECEGVLVRTTTGGHGATCQLFNHDPNQPRSVTPAQGSRTVYVKPLAGLEFSLLGGKTEAAAAGAGVVSGDQMHAKVWDQYDDNARVEKLYHGGFAPDHEYVMMIHGSGCSDSTVLQVRHEPVAVQLSTVVSSDHVPAYMFRGVRFRFKEFNPANASAAGLYGLISIRLGDGRRVPFVAGPDELGRLTVREEGHAVADMSGYHGSVAGGGNGRAFDLRWRQRPTTQEWRYGFVRMQGFDELDLPVADRLGLQLSDVSVVRSGSTYTWSPAIPDPSGVQWKSTSHAIEGMKIPATAAGLTTEPVIVVGAGPAMDAVRPLYKITLDPPLHSGPAPEFLPLRCVGRQKCLTHAALPVDSAPGVWEPSTQGNLEFKMDMQDLAGTLEGCRLECDNMEACEAATFDEDNKTCTLFSSNEKEQAQADTTRFYDKASASGPAPAQHKFSLDGCTVSQKYQLNVMAGHVKIRSEEDPAKCLAATSGSSNLMLAHCDEDASAWVSDTADNGAMRLMHRDTSKYLTGYASGQAGVADATGTTDQQWQMRTQEAAAEVSPVTLRLHNNPNMVLDYVKTGDGAWPAAVAQRHTSPDDPTQKFTITGYNPGGSVQIHPYDDGSRCLDSGSLGFGPCDAETASFNQVQVQEGGFQLMHGNQYLCATGQGKVVMQDGVYDQFCRWMEGPLDPSKVVAMKVDSGYLLQAADDRYLTVSGGSLAMSGSGERAVWKLDQADGGYRIVHGATDRALTCGAQPGVGEAGAGGATWTIERGDDPSHFGLRCLNNYLSSSQLDFTQNPSHWRFTPTGLPPAPALSPATETRAFGEPLVTVDELPLKPGVYNISTAGGKYLYARRYQAKPNRGLSDDNNSESGRWRWHVEHHDKRVEDHVYRIRVDYNGHSMNHDLLQADTSLLANSATAPAAQLVIKKIEGGDTYSVSSVEGEPLHSEHQEWKFIDVSGQQRVEEPTPMPLAQGTYFIFMEDGNKKKYIHAELGAATTNFSDEIKWVARWRWIVTHREECWYGHMYRITVENNGLGSSNSDNLSYNLKFVADPDDGKTHMLVRHEGGGLYTVAAYSGTQWKSAAEGSNQARFRFIPVDTNATENRVALVTFNNGSKQPVWEWDLGRVQRLMHVDDDEDGEHDADGQTHANITFDTERYCLFVWKRQTEPKPYYTSGREGPWGEMTGDNKVMKKNFFLIQPKLDGTCEPPGEDDEDEDEDEEDAASTIKKKGGKAFA